MSDQITILSDDEAATMREALALHERQKAYQAALGRHEVYLALEPLVNSPAFIAVHKAIVEFHENGPKDDLFFGSHVSAIFYGMTNLGVQIAHWTTPVDPMAHLPPALPQEGPETPVQTPEEPEGNSTSG